MRCREHYCRSCLPKGWGKILIVDDQKDLTTNLMQFIRSCLAVAGKPALRLPKGRRPNACPARIKPLLPVVSEVESTISLRRPAYACLTHVGIKAYHAQGQNKSKKVLRLEPISKLKSLSE